MRKLRQQDWILIIILAASSLICIRLGFWQLDRLHQRTNRNAVIEARLSAPLRAFSPIQEDYTRVTIEGTFMAGHDIVLQNRSLDDISGYHLITPLETEDGLVVLIDRGWIAYEVGANLALEAYQLSDPVSIEGVLLPSQAQPRWGFLADPIPAPGEPPLKTWRVIDIGGIQKQMPFLLHHQFVSLTGIEPAHVPQPVPDFQLDLSNGPHLSYAIQWFSFATIAILGGAIMLRRSGWKQSG